MITIEGAVDLLDRALPADAPGRMGGPASGYARNNAFFH